MASLDNNSNRSNTLVKNKMSIENDIKIEGIIK